MLSGSPGTRKGQDAEGDLSDHMASRMCGWTEAGKAYVQPMTEDVYSPSLPEIGTVLPRLGRKAGAWPSDISTNWPLSKAHSGLGWV